MRQLGLLTGTEIKAILLSNYPDSDTLTENDNDRNGEKDKSTCPVRSAAYPKKYFPGRVGHVLINI